MRKSLKKKLMKYTPKITQQTDIYTVVRCCICGGQDVSKDDYTVTLQNPNLENTFDKIVSKEFYETVYVGKQVEMTIDFNEFSEPVDLLKKSEYESSYRIDVVMSTIFIIVQIGMFLSILGI
jgi:hypothetical protein